MEKAVGERSHLSHQEYGQDRAQRSFPLKGQSHSVGEGEGGAIWENSIETCIWPYVKQIASASSMHEAGHSSQCIGTEGRDEEEGGRGIQDQDSYIPVVDSCQCMAKTTTLL